MTKLRYRAYISYSHKDEAWAAWLHRALESYRVPRNLIGNKTAVGEVPARIRPVFRDRDDLSSATDLGDTVKQALADSESLIVLCSPEATSSRWVKDEIRHFLNPDAGPSDSEETNAQRLYSLTQGFPLILDFVIRTEKIQAYSWKENSNNRNYEHMSLEEVQKELRGVPIQAKTVRR